MSFPRLQKRPDHFRLLGRFPIEQVKVTAMGNRICRLGTLLTKRCCVPLKTLFLKGLSMEGRTPDEQTRFDDTA